MRRRISRIGWALVFSSILVLGAACGSAGSESDAESGEPIRIGVLISKTGALESYGKQTINGFELGIEYATGGTKKVAGRPIAWIDRKSVAEGTRGAADGR